MLSIEYAKICKGGEQMKIVTFIMICQALVFISYNIGVLTVIFQVPKDKRAVPYFGWVLFNFMMLFWFPTMIANAVDGYI